MKTSIVESLIVVCLLVLAVQAADESPDDTHFNRQDRDFRPLQFGKRDDFRPLQFGKKDNYRPLQFGKRASTFLNSFRLTDPRVPAAKQWQFIYPQLVN